MDNIYQKKLIGAQEITGPLLIVEGIQNVGFGEMIEIEQKGMKRLGRVLEVSGDRAVCQVFEGTSGIDREKVRIRFTGTPMKLPVSLEMVGRVFDGVGRPIDGGGEIMAEFERDINGAPLNPDARAYPHENIITGISAIDGITTLIRGQKLPIFSGSGLPHNEIAAQIVNQAKIATKENFNIIFASLGIKADTASFFQRKFEEGGAIDRLITFQNLADSPTIERLITPRCALTAAEYLAFDKGRHVLVILTDLTNYCEALREVSTARGEVPSRKGYPGYLYSDLATLYERTGRAEGKKGSITQLPILTMPNDDITHPIPDLTGYITEGQVVLSRELHQKGIYPPIDILSSLSRLMKDGIGEGQTRKDHPNLYSQLYASYSRVQRVRSLASIIGEDELSETDRRYLKFGEDFEVKFLKQDSREARRIEETLDIGWEVLRDIPESELTRVSKNEIQEFWRK
ncbi:MAG: V-type ATP synthase subunit B [candidate division WOR-3 bacterium]|nr:V-type ATP synthase subunit B [candidate division WOR-3 bacterium]